MGRVDRVADLCWLLVAVFRMGELAGLNPRGARTPSLLNVLGFVSEVASCLIYASLSNGKILALDG